MPPIKNYGQNIQVSLRCRPLNAYEKKLGSYAIADASAQRREVTIREKHSASLTKTFTFDHVFSPVSTQLDVYQAVVSPLIEEVIQGYNCTVFAYGQTGTGKTFTMEGERTDSMQDVSWDKDPMSGIIPRAMKHIFDSLISSDSEFSVRVSYVELYNEELYDLLTTYENPLKLRIYEDSSRKGSTIIQGLDEVPVHNKDEVYKLLEKGAQNRRTASTLLNDRSSRSHCVFTVTIHIKEASMEGDELLKIGKLNLVDLAGSENIGRSGAVDKRAREAGNINQSLLTLGRVITALVEHAPHIPYRESKLTRMLQDSLGGKTKTSIIATISPALCNFEETMSTLEYAHRAKSVTNRPEVNQKLTKKCLLKDYTEELERVRRDLAACREKNGIYISETNYDSMTNRLAMQSDLIKEHEEKIAYLSEEKDKITSLFTTTKSELDDMTDQLAKTMDSLSLTKTDLEEQRFLVEEHLKAEARLTDEANQLLQSANSSVQDVSLLHDKLDRKRAVDDRNVRNRDGFVSSFDSFITTFRQSIEATSANQIEQLQETKRSLSATLEMQKEIHMAHQADVEQALGATNAVKASIEADRILGDEARAEVDVQTAGLHSHKDKFVNHNSDFVAYVHDMLLKSSRFCSQHLALTAALKHAHEQHMSELKARIQADTAAIVASVTDAVTTLESYVADSQSNAATWRSEVERTMAQYKQAHEEQMAYMEQQYEMSSNALKSLLVHPQTARREVERVDAAVRMLVPVSDVSRVMETHILGELDVTNARLNDHANEITDVCTAISGTNETLASRVDADSKTSSQIAEQLTADAVTYLHKHRERHHACDRVQSEALSYVNDREKRLRDRGDRLEQELDSLSKALLSPVAQLDRQLAGHETARDETIRATGDMSGLALRHVQSTAVDVPTGQTPERRDFVYPRNVYKRAPHSTLLAAFRANRREREDTVNEETSQGETPNEEMPKDEEQLKEATRKDGSFAKDDIPDTVSEAGSNRSVATATSGFSSAGVASKENNPGLRKLLGKASGMTPRSRVPLRASNNNTKN